MISLSPQTRVYVFPEHVDFRNGLDGLVALAKLKTREDPFCGALFVFRNRGRTAIKAVAYDGQGFWLFMKRLSEGKFQHWPKSASNEAHVRLLARELSVLLWNGDHGQARMREDWKKLAP
jgi:transposase